MGLVGLVTLEDPVGERVEKALSGTESNTGLGVRWAELTVSVGHYTKSPCPSSCSHQLRVTSVPMPWEGGRP